MSSLSSSSSSSSSRERDSPLVRVVRKALSAGGTFLTSEPPVSGQNYASLLVSSLSRIPHPLPTLIHKVRILGGQRPSPLKGAVGANRQASSQRSNPPATSHSNFWNLHFGNLFPRNSLGILRRLFYSENSFHRLWPSRSLAAPRGPRGKERREKKSSITTKLAATRA